jgi:hypothetical protein
MDIDMLDETRTKESDKQTSKQASGVRGREATREWQRWNIRGCTRQLLYRINENAKYSQLAGALFAVVVELYVSMSQ